MREETKGRPARQREAEGAEEALFGRNAVLEALKAGRAINRICLARGERQGSVKEIAALAKAGGIVVQEVDPRRIQEAAGALRHQGVMAYVAPVAYASVDEILARAAASGKAPFIVLLDELEDPRNLGAILRTADAAGVHGVLIPKRRGCQLSAAVAKTAAGALEYVPVARVGNIVQALRELKEKGLWIVGADMDGASPYYEADLTGPIVLVVGSEGRGIGRLVKEACDFLVRIPMCGQINSLNASVAAGILLFEINKQRKLRE